MFGEGLRWDGAQLSWVDLMAGRLQRAPLDRLDAPDVVEVGRPLGAFAPATAGGLVLAAGQGLVHRADDGTLTELAALEPETHRMNDAACDPAGRLLGRARWRTTSGRRAGRCTGSSSTARSRPCGAG